MPLSAYTPYMYDRSNAIIEIAGATAGLRLPATPPRLHCGSKDTRRDGEYRRRHPESLYRRWSVIHGRSR
jgi:hypothetical protein